MSRGASFMLISLVYLAGCGDNETPEARESRLRLEKAEADYQEAKQQSFVKTAKLMDEVSDAFSQDDGKGSPYGRQVCIATISEVMSQPTSIMTAAKIDSSTYRVDYRRDDGERWSYRCQVTSNRARWATNEDGQPGLWRFGENVRFAIEGGDLILTLDEFGNGDERYRYDLSTVEPKKP